MFRPAALLGSLAVACACSAASDPGSAAPAEDPVAADRAALAPLREAVRRDPEDYEAQRRLAIALHEHHRGEAAIEAFERALELREDTRSLLDLALAYGSAARLDDAERIYGRILAREPRHAIALQNLASVAFRRGDMPEAVERYRRVLAVKPDYLAARYHLASTLERLGRAREAYREYNAVLALTPDSPAELELYDNALYQMASLDLAHGEAARAAEMLETLLEQRPDHFGAHYAYARALMQLGRTAEAREQLELHRRILAAREPTGPVATID